MQLREKMQLPPYTFQVTVRAKAPRLDDAINFLNSARQRVPEQLTCSSTIYGPIPSNMERKAGYSRAYLLLNANQRGVFSALLKDWTRQISKLPSARKVRWSIDVDPLEYD